MTTQQAGMVLYPGAVAEIEGDKPLWRDGIAWLSAVEQRYLVLHGEVSGAGGWGGARATITEHMNRFSHRVWRSELRMI